MNILKNFLIFAILCLLLSSCNFFIRLRYMNKKIDEKGHTNCYIFPKQDTSKLKFYKNSYVRTFDLKKNDTVVSIGVGSGWREFLFSIFTDGLTFYMEDIDTSCITKEKIKNIYLPHYSDMRGCKLTNNFIPVVGTDTTVDLKNNSANKVLIVNVYHHFSNDISMVKECKRILKTNGNLMIGEFIMRKNKHSHRFCRVVGGNYKSENNFVKDIVDIGFKCDTIYRQGKHYRIFIFTKK